MNEMAGVAGFEPAHGDTKNRCLTAWLHPKKQSIEKLSQLPKERKPKWLFLKTLIFEHE